MAHVAMSLYDLPELQDEVIASKLRVYEESVASYPLQIAREEAELAACQELLTEMGDPHGCEPWGPNDTRWADRLDLQKMERSLRRNLQIMQNNYQRSLGRCGELRGDLALTLDERVAKERIARFAKARPLLTHQTWERFGPLTENNLRRCWFLLCASSNHGDLLCPLGRDIPAELLAELVGRDPADF